MRIPNLSVLKQAKSFNTLSHRWPVALTTISARRFEERHLCLAVDSSRGQQNKNPFHEYLRSGTKLRTGILVSPRTKQRSKRILLRERACIDVYCIVLDPYEF